MTAPAVVSWAARFGRLSLGSTSLAFLGYAFTPWIFSVLALGELVTDQLPSTPSRTVPVQFGTRLVVGALCGGAIGASGGSLIAGATSGIVGAVIGTLGGRAVRGRLAAAFGNDRPAAIIEDVVAIGGGAADRGDAAMKSFDAIIIGAGQAGPSLAGTADEGGHDRRLRRAQAVRRHVRQHGLHADQDARRERLCGASRQARRGLRCRADRTTADRHEESQGTRRRRVVERPRGRRARAAQPARLHGVP